MMIHCTLETLNRKRNRIHNIPWPSKVSVTCIRKTSSRWKSRTPQDAMPWWSHHVVQTSRACWLSTYKDSSGLWCHQVLPLMWPNFMSFLLAKFLENKKKVHSTWKDGHLGTCVINTKDYRVLYQIYKCGEIKLLWLWPCQLQTRPWIIKSIKSLESHQINEGINTNKHHIK